MEDQGIVVASVIEVVLVSPDDEAIGTAEKLAAHRAPGQRHRAFSVLLFDDAGRLLLQRRAFGKYHFGGRWSNSCCGHPAPGESTVEAASRRVREELGPSAVAVLPAGRFHYVAADPDTGLVENEVDHVLWARLAPAACGQLCPDPSEVAEVRWVERPALLALMAADPAAFTPWLPPVLEHFGDRWPSP